MASGDMWCVHGLSAILWRVNFLSLTALSPDRTKGNTILTSVCSGNLRLSFVIKLIKRGDLEQVHWRKGQDQNSSQTLSFCFVGLYFKKKCPKGKNCNFLHVFRNPRNEFWEADRDYPAPQRSWARRSRSPASRRRRSRSPSSSSRKRSSRSSSRVSRSSSTSYATGRRDRQHRSRSPRRSSRRRSRSPRRSKKKSRSKSGSPQNRTSDSPKSRSNSQSASLHYRDTQKEETKGSTCSIRNPVSFSVKPTDKLKSGEVKVDLSSLWTEEDETGDKDEIESAEPQLGWVVLRGLPCWRCHRINTGFRKLAPSLVCGRRMPIWLFNVVHLVFSFTNNVTEKFLWADVTTAGVLLPTHWSTASVEQHIRNNKCHFQVPDLVLQVSLAWRAIYLSFQWQRWSEWFRRRKEAKTQEKEETQIEEKVRKNGKDKRR